MSGADAAGVIGALGARYNGVTSRYARWGTSATGARILLAHVRLIRPTTRLWFDGIMPLAVVLVLTRGHAPFRVTVLVIAGLSLIHVALTIVNDLQDVEGDLRSTEPLRALRPIARGTISRRVAVVEAIVAGVAGVGLAFAVSWKTGLIAAALGAVALEHELPPVRAQGRPILGQIAGLAGVAGILAGIASAVDFEGLTDAGPYLLFVTVYMGLAEMLVKDIRDVDNDAAGGKITTAVRYGAARAAAIAAATYLVTAGLWAWFVHTYSGFRPAAVAVASAILAVWFVYTAVAARELDRRFSKTVCISLHAGSILVFTCVNLATIAAVAR